MNKNHNVFLTFSYLALFTIWAVSYYVVIPVPVNLIATSTLIVFIGSHRSLNLLTHESEGGVPSEEKEVLSASDAYKFPFIGSAALFGLYVAFKYFDKDTINLLMSAYFCLVGVFTLTGFLSKFVSQFLVSTKKYGFKTVIPLLGELNCLLTVAEIICMLISCIFSYFYFQTKHYMLNNILGISFCIQSIERISIGSYKVGAILLVGLFFYDIFWVFGTDVMVTVAKSFDGPIKLLFPRVLPTLTEKGQFSLLGLGDIVVPGLFVALLLRLDAVTAKISFRDPEHASFFKPYFLTNVVCYALGLGCTVGVMYFFNAAQPALLYLVPACLGGSLAVGLARGELSVLFAYDEEAAHKEDKAAKQKLLVQEAAAVGGAEAKKID
jgi:minor histocompatibility antigen H13